MTKSYSVGAALAAGVLLFPTPRPWLGGDNNTDSSGKEKKQ